MKKENMNNTSFKIAPIYMYAFLNWEKKSESNKVDKNQIKTWY